ncbi:hypothetical protein DFH06DRAFT_175568 [Mycena polygramma]|nr:hypothetical protein DFH06DRAFT_175568 [Mycena polygramma]
MSSTQTKSTDSVDLPAPLLPAAGGSGSLYSEAWLTEKDFDPAVLLESPPPPRRPAPKDFRSRVRAGASKFIGWPAVVILGQVVIQCIGWGFFLHVKLRGQIPLPSDTAVWVKNNSHLVTLLATLVATVLGGCSSFLFSYAIRRSMALYLYRPMSLATLGASVSIATRSVVFHRRNWRWPTVSMLLFVLAGVQTSGWSTLLTPVTIIVSSPLVGSDVNLLSPALRQMYGNGQLDNCIYTTPPKPSLFTSESQSGYAAARAASGTPTTFGVMDQVFNVSTGGIFPAYLTSVNASAWFTNASVIPVTTHHVGAPPKTGFTSNYSMTHQGFTADVSCSFRNLTNTTTPSLFYKTDEVKDWGHLNINKVFGTITYSEIDSPCGEAFGLRNLNWTSAITLPSRNYVMVIPCQSNKADNYTVIILSHGTYAWLPTTVCSVAPKIMTTHVDYTSVINTTLPSNGDVVLDQEGPTGRAAINALKNMVYLLQGLNENIFGDQLASMRTERDVLKPLEVYLQGFMEYTGSVFRACLVANTTLNDALGNTSIPTNGTFRTETLGWTYVSRTTRWVLMPGTIIALATIVVVTVALYLHVGDLPKESNQFDPSDPLHLITAASAGGLNNAFKGFSRNDIQEGEKLKVVLGSVAGRGHALVRADEYRPVFSNAFSPRSAYDEGAE